MNLQTTSTNATLLFPINHGWINGTVDLPIAQDESSAWLPTPDSRELAAELILGGDEQFRHLSRGAGTNGWLVFPEIYAGVLRVLVHDVGHAETLVDLAKLADSPISDGRASSLRSAVLLRPKHTTELLTLPRVSYGRGNNDEKVITQFGEPIGLVLNDRPLIEAWRHLRPAELATIAAIRRFFTSEQYAKKVASSHAMRLITDTLSGKEWNSDTLGDVADIVRRNGFTIAEPEA